MWKIVIIMTLTIIAMTYIKFGIDLWKWDDKIPAIIEFMVSTMAILIIVNLIMF